MFFPFSCAAFFQFGSYQSVCVLCSFQIFLHDYLKKKGFLETAQIFQNEAQVNNGQTLAGMYMSDFALSLPKNQFLMCNFGSN